MKRICKAFLVLLAILPVSCSKNNTNPDIVYFATVTFRPLEDGKYYLKQDDSTALIVLNKDLQKYPFEKGVEKRALISYRVEKQEASAVPNYKYTKAIYIGAMDTIYTKHPVSAAGVDPSVFGNDVLGLYLGRDNFPTTLVEDGYLNVSFEMPMGNFGIIHEINLVTGTNPDDPYLMELRHDAKGDVYVTSSRNLVNFSLKDLPDTKGETVPLTVRWRSMVTGEFETVKFDYCSRTDW